MLKPLAISILAGIVIYGGATENPPHAEKSDVVTLKRLNDCPA
jgi:hypothetical protein